jgi:hypothetical protein
VSSIEGLDELLDELDDLEQDILDAAAFGLAKGLKRTVGVAKALCSADSGQLRNSITDIVERKGDTVDGQALATAGHAIYVEMGTGPVGQANHQGVAPVPVTYRTTGWVYRSKKDGKFYGTKGQPARPYLYPAYKQTRKLILSDVREAVEQRLRER